MDKESLKAEINAKQNKALLMSIGLLPLPDESSPCSAVNNSDDDPSSFVAASSSPGESSSCVTVNAVHNKSTPYKKVRENELLNRYQFIQKYKKESRQFGTQRRASEGHTTEITLRNLSVNVKFTDVTRLTLRMENKLVEQFAEYNDWQVVDDIELMVSVAPAGSVNPKTSHSTIKMLRAIVACNLELFRTKNVRFEGSHTIIDDKLGQYTVHLGSGVVHQIGNAMLFVVPVHSQHRGRISLPFVDDNPKTAEIMSKILLFAEDEKVKDPNILRQIQ